MNGDQPKMSGSLWVRGGKRVFDVVATVALLLVLSPALLLAAVLIKLSSRGPVFFRQTRSGKDCALFRPFKFRTMRGDRTPDRKELIPLEHPDITPIGRLLRRFKIERRPIDIEDRLDPTD